MPAIRGQTRLLLRLVQHEHRPLTALAHRSRGFDRAVIAILLVGWGNALAVRPEPHPNPALMAYGLESYLGP